MNKYFVTSDIHGAYEQLIEALNKNGFDKDNPEHKLIVCGDIFDRFDGAKEVLKFLQELEDRFIFVKGNHEVLLRECVEEICKGFIVSGHHFHNGTVGTISTLTGYGKMALLSRDIGMLRDVWAQMKPILNWIDEKSVNYYEVGNYIFVHGWFPPYLLDNREGWDNEENKELWKDAMWLNGMDEWSKGCRLEGKTIVCGHWHCSWGWSHIIQERKEWPNKGGDPKNPVWKKSFEPFMKDGIIALDSCIAYTGFLNCIVIEDGEVK